MAVRLPSDIATIAIVTDDCLGPCADIGIIPRHTIFARDINQCIVDVFAAAKLARYETIHAVVAGVVPFNLDSLIESRWLTVCRPMLKMVARLGITTCVRAMIVIR